METKMLAKAFENLMNGGAAVAGVDGLEAAILSIQGEQQECRRELSMLPTKRADAILADNSDATLDKLERRENLLYRSMEKGDLQIAELRTVLDQHRSIGHESRVQHHQSAVAAAVSNLEMAIVGAVQANGEMIAALEHAKRELGADAVNRLLPHAHFAGLLNDQCLEAWRSNLQNQKERVARERNRTSAPQPLRVAHSSGPEYHQQYERA
jgi:hypothetical protein